MLPNNRTNEQQDEEREFLHYVDDQRYSLERRLREEAMKRLGPKRGKEITY